MKTLKEQLEDFEKQIKDFTEVNNLKIILQEKFKELARTFLYGGFIKVRDDYQIFIRTVEFYFHSEKADGVHDPIVYHRNGRDLEETPYFPMMSLHAHASGFDIAFESQGNYRASVLIRSYEVKDKQGMYLKWNKEKKMFVQSKERENIVQSTYLYALLNGFSISEDSDNKVLWENYSPEERFKEEAVKAYPRENVPLFRPEGNDYVRITKDYYYQNMDYVETLHPEMKETSPKFFTSGKEICLRDPKLWQYRREL
jgi:hypothetical protein